MSKQRNAVADRTWDELFALIPLSAEEIARRLKVVRASFYNLKNGEHGRPPLDLLARLVALIDRVGTVDGSPKPDRPEFVRAWRREFLEGAR